MTDFAIKRNGPDDELTHWKYIKKVKGKNGKWQYIYDTRELDKYNKGVERTFRRHDGGTSTVLYRKRDGLFDAKTTIKIGSLKYGGPDDKYTYVEQGKLSRKRAKGEKWVYDNILKKNSKAKRSLKKASKSIDRGRTKLQQLLGR